MGKSLLQRRVGAKKEEKNERYGKNSMKIFIHLNTSFYKKYLICIHPRIQTC